MFSLNYRVTLLLLVVQDTLQLAATLLALQGVLQATPQLQEVATPHPLEGATPQLLDLPVSLQQSTYHLGMRVRYFYCQGLTGQEWSVL